MSKQEQLWAALAVVMDQIDSCGPTEMIGAAFDGRELDRAREALRDCAPEGRKYDIRTKGFGQSVKP